jgi:hypothetical protein
MKKKLRSCNFTRNPKKKMLQSFEILAITSSGSPIKSSDYHKGIFLSKNLSGSLTKTLKIKNYMTQFHKKKKTLSRERKKKEQEKDLSCHKG